MGRKWRGLHRPVLQKHEPDRRRERLQAGPQLQILELGLRQQGLLVSAQQGERERRGALQQQNRSVSGLHGWNFSLLQRIKFNGSDS